MLSTYLIAGFSLRAILRSPFFWVWNLIIFLLILSLSFITFFDFEDGSAVSELFLATLALSGCVNSLVFQGGTVRELASKQWDLLLTRPLNPMAIALGRFLALTFFQAIVGVVFLMGYLLESRMLHHQIPESLGKAWLIVMLQVAMVGAFYGLLAIWLNEFWAITAMVGAFLLGHLSIYLKGTLPLGLSFMVSMIFCAIPDLEPPALAGEANVPGIGSGALLWAATYAISYIATMIYVSTVSIRAALDRK